MKRIDVYTDQKGTLTLRQYDSRDPDRAELIYKNSDAYHYLNKISQIIPMRDLKINVTNDKIKSFDTFYENYNIRVKMSDDLDKYENALSPFLDKIVKFGEHQRIKEIKQSRRDKGLKEIPKVKRNNKHRGKQLTATVLVAATLLTATYFSLTSNAEKVQPSNVDDTSQIVRIVEEESDNIGDIAIDYVSNTKNDDIVRLEYIDNFNTEKAMKTKELYGDTIAKYANDYGIDPIIAIAVATQERGIHSSKKDPGGATGLMQIQNSVWVNQEVSAYNFESGKQDRFIVTEDMLGNVESNIKIGCMILQNAMQYMDYNILAGIQCYNMGYGNMSKILNAYANEKGISRDEVLNNKTDTGWLEYRDMINVGDQKYLEHVLSWVGPNVNVSVNSKNGETSVLSCTNSFDVVKNY